MHEISKRTNPILRFNYFRSCPSFHPYFWMSRSLHEGLSIVLLSVNFINFLDEDQYKLPISLFRSHKFMELLIFLGCSPFPYFSYSSKATMILWSCSICYYFSSNRQSHWNRFEPLKFRCIFTCHNFFEHYFGANSKLFSKVFFG